MPKIPVLIVGAGPSGLNLSLALARRKVPHRVISDANGPGEQSRAMVVQARTLEFYDQFGFAEEVVEQGVIVEKAHVREGGESGEGREVLSFSFKFPPTARGSISARMRAALCRDGFLIINGRGNCVLKSRI